jgi:superfamily II DNA or RNA helicase
MRFALRPYQDTALAEIVAYMARHPLGRLLLVMPTRSGKTFVAALLMARILRLGLQGLWVVHREELLDEAVRHLLATGVHKACIGLIKHGRTPDPAAKIQIASEGTLDHRTLPPAHLVLTDESHRDTAPRRRRIRRAFPRAFKLGFTATPTAPKGRRLKDDFDEMLVAAQPSELIHDGFIAVPTLYAPDQATLPDLRNVRILGDDYRAEDLEPLLLRAAVLDAHVAEWARLAEGRRTAAYPATILHSRALVARFEAAGIAAAHLDHTVKTPERRRIIAALRGGALRLVASVDVISEGTNLPEVKCVLGARPTASLRLYIQQGMRCATPWGDVAPRLLDVAGNVYRHGFPFADRRWSLDGPSGAPIDPHEAIVKRCGCGAIMRGIATICSACQHEFPLPDRLVEIDPGPRALRLHEITLADKARMAEHERLITFARQRRFKDPDGWAAQVIERKHGAIA